ncbi:MAG: radical SAM protein [Nanoarchaeota archaeon]|nr:radical SAM protein [Nanoarchaeota archaeon]
MRALNFGIALAKTKLGLLDMPYKLKLYMTDKCNCRCKTCRIWKKKPSAELDAHELQRFFKKNNDFNWIDITGGEIFLREDINEIMDIILSECKNLYLLHFPTNGILTTKIVDTVRQIKKSFKGRLIVSISIDGPRQLHDSLRGVNGCWDSAIESFKKISEINKGNVFFGYTLSSYNTGMLDKTFNELKKHIPSLTFDALHINLAQHSSHYYANEDEQFIKHKQNIIRDLEFFARNKNLKTNLFSLLESRFTKLLKQYALTNRYPLKKCRALKATVTVNPIGDVYPCIHFNQKVGSLRDSDFDLKQILSNKKAAELKKEILQKCPHCWTACEAYPSLL